MDKSNENRIVELTPEILTELGFRWKLDELSEEEIEKADDPFYWYKGEAKIFEVINDFYTAEGGKLFTPDQVKAYYEEVTGRQYTAHPMPEDTVPTDLPVNPKAIGANLIKGRMKDGPGKGKVFLYPKGCPFFVYQVKEGGKTAAYKYQKKRGTKTIFLYQHEVL